MEAIVRPEPEWKVLLRLMLHAVPFAVLIALIGWKFAIVALIVTWAIRRKF